MATEAPSFSMAALAAALEDSITTVPPPTVQHQVAAPPDTSAHTATAGPNKRSRDAPPPQPAPATLSIVWDPRCLLHLAHTNPDNIWDDDHQKEQPGRLAGIVARLRASGRFAAPGVVQRPCAPASRAQLLRVHTVEHLAHVAALDTRSNGGGGGDAPPPLDDGLARSLLDDAAALTAAGNAAPGYVFNASRSVYSCDYTPAVAALAAGGVCAAVDDVATGAAAASFAVVRPPGHHCSAHGEGGFCWLNNVAVAVRHAQDAHGVRRVAVLDWDIHHGDGTQAIFAGDASVLLVSVHRYMPQRGFGFYPGTGSGADVGGGVGGNIVNVPLPYFGCGDHEYAAVMESVVLPLLAEWAPELVVVSCGFDAAHGDPLGGMHITPGGYAHLTAAVAALDPPRGVVVALEGGYNVDAISASADAVVSALLARGPRQRRAGGTPAAAAAVRLPPPPRPPPFVHPAALQCIRNVAAAQAPFFACMAALDAAAAATHALQTVEAPPTPAKGSAGAAAAPLAPATAPDAAPTTVAPLSDADCVTPRESRPSSASIDEAAASQPPALLPRQEFDHQALRRWDYGKHVAPAGGEYSGWVSVTYARPHFPPKKFAYTDSPYYEPVVDCHMYALLAPAVPELAPPGGAAAGGAAAAVGAAATTGVTAVAAPAAVDDDDLGGLTAALGSMSVANASSCAPAADAPPVAAVTHQTASPLQSGNHLTPAAALGSPAAAARSGYRTRSQAAKEEQHQAALSASAPAAALPPAADDAAMLQRAHAVAAQISAAAAPSSTAAETAVPTPQPEPVAAVVPQQEPVVAAAPIATTAASAPVTQPTSAAVAPAGAFWKPLGPCQAWVAVEHWHPTREAALAAVATEKKPAASSGGGRRSSGGVAAAAAAAAASAAATVPAPAAADAEPLERHYLVVTDMLGRTVLRLKLRPGGVKGSGSRKPAGLLPPALGTAAASPSPAAAEPGKRAPPLAIPARVVGPEGVGLFPDSSGDAGGAAGGEWTLLDGADADDGFESRVLVAPGCAAAVEALHAGAAAALPPVGWVPVVPTSRTDALQQAIRAAASSEPDAATAAPLPQCFRRGDYAPLALRLYFGDERDDDKLEKGQWTGRPSAADFHNLLARYAVGGGAAAPSR